MRWEVYRCDFVDEYGPEPDRACGIREVGVGGALGRMIVSDTNREECCHHMRLADAQEIVDAHNLKEDFIERASNTIIERERAQLQKVIDGVDSVTAPVPHSVLDAVAMGGVANFQSSYKVTAVERGEPSAEKVTFTFPTLASEEIDEQERKREKRKRDLAEHNADVSRDDRQRVIGEWTRRCFGDEEALSVPQRALRVLEESIELAQACSVPRKLVHELMIYVYDREPGDIQQELGGIGCTLLAFGAAAMLSVDVCEQNEVDRVLSKPPEHFAERNARKNAAGFNVIKEKSSGAD